MAEPISLSELMRGTALERSALVCTVSRDEVSAVWCRAKSSGREVDRARRLPKVSHYELSNAEQTKALLKKAGTDCPVVLALPRTKYLVREFFLPVVAEDEALGMIALEAEAESPPGMDEIEVAYRPLGEAVEGKQRYEVFFARRSDIVERLSQADELGLACDHVLPNSVLLEWLLAKQDFAPQMLVYASAPDQLELATRMKDGRVTVRALGAVATARRRLPQVVSEMLRSGQAVGKASDESVSVAWLGHPLEEEVPSSDMAWIHEQAILLDDLLTPDVSSEITGPLNLHTAYLGVLGVGLLDPTIRSSKRQVDLLPQARRHAEQMRQVIVSGIWTGGGLIAALLLVSFGLWLFAGRYEARRDHLAEQIHAIEGEGREVSHRIAQLDAMHATWDRRNLMRDVLAALYEASPPGLEYHQVEVKENGSCYLRGQAQSVALPFELPEKLEAQPIFTDVTLTDAGQARRGAGTVTEFRIDCRVVFSPAIEASELAEIRSGVGGEQ